MKKAGSVGFSCQLKAWCAFISPEGVLIVVVDDGRYAGAACDVAGLVIAPRARFHSCRSGAPMLSGASLRKTGSIEIDLSAAAAGKWGVTTAMAGAVRPWSIHRQYDWRRNLYDSHLPEWVSKPKSSARLEDGFVVSDQAGMDNRSHAPTDLGNYSGISDNGE